MQEVRKIMGSIKAVPTSDGTGVRLYRAFGSEDTDLLDPFLLLDHFGSDDPDDYMIPEAVLANGARVKVVAGNFNGIVGPVRDLIVPVEYLDVKLEREGSLEREMPKEHNVFAYVFEGSTRFEKGGPLMEREHLAIFGKGDGVNVEAGPNGARFLLVSGRPIREPIAWGTPS